MTLQAPVVYTWEPGSLLPPESPHVVTYIDLAFVTPQKNPVFVRLETKSSSGIRGNVYLLINPAWVSVALLPPSMLTGSSVGEAWCSLETCTDTLSLTHTHTRAVSQSSSKEPNKTFTTWLSLPPTFLSVCFFGLFLHRSFSLSLPPCIRAWTSLRVSSVASLSARRMTLG